MLRIAIDADTLASYPGILAKKVSPRPHAPEIVAPDSPEAKAEAAKVEAQRAQDYHEKNAARIFNEPFDKPTAGLAPYTNTLADCTDLSEASLERAIAEMQNTWDRDRIDKVQAMWEQTGPNGIYDTEKVKAYAQQMGVCLGYASGRHHWETDPFTTGDAAAAPGNRCVCGAVKPD